VTTTTSTIPPTTCAGEPGGPDAQGLPLHLPTRLQIGGVAYVFVRAESPADAGTLTRLGCVGPFELARSDLADQADVVYLRATGTGAGSTQVYRFESALTFEVEFEVTERPQTISALDQSYRLAQVWESSVYSSPSVILFVDDPADPAPAVVYAVNVSQTVVGEAIGEYRLTEDAASPTEEIAAAGAQAGLHPDLTINGRVYVLAAVYTPAGTTQNGFMTLFSSSTGDVPDRLLGRDQRDRDLFVFVVAAPAGEGESTGEP
jgi:hypothetical protein